VPSFLGDGRSLMRETCLASLLRSSARVVDRLPQLEVLRVARTAGLEERTLSILDLLHQWLASLVAAHTCEDTNRGG
jgi:hypothetical protein